MKLRRASSKLSSMRLPLAGSLIYRAGIDGGIRIPQFCFPPVASLLPKLSAAAPRASVDRRAVWPLQNSLISRRGHLMVQPTFAQFALCTWELYTKAMTC